MISEVFQQNPYLKSLEPEARKELNEYARIHHIKKNTIISRPGSGCGSFPLVISGEIRVYEHDAGGREITLYRIEPGESCVLTITCIVSESDFPAYAVTEKHSEIISIPAPVFRRWVREYASWQNYVFFLMNRRFKELINVVNEITFRRVDHRLYEYLIHSFKKEKRTIIEKSHNEVANEIGTAREVVTRMLKDLRHEGILELERKKIILKDVETLRKKISKNRD
jgi:CRP/FNR family transcriptional regulator